MDEIINHQKICGFNIDESVVYFFLNHQKLWNLTNLDDRIIDNPIIAYYKTTRQNTEMIATFGSPKKEDKYYFSKYDFICNESVEKEGYVRFAIFLGKIKMDINDLDEYDSDYLLNDDKYQWSVNNYRQQIPLTYHYLHL